MSRFTYGKNSAYNALENKDGIKSIYVLNNFSDERLLNVIKSKDKHSFTSISDTYLFHQLIILFMFAK